MRDANLYLKETVLQDNHTDTYPCNLSFIDYTIKENIKEKCIPIIHQDLVPGNFIVYMKNNDLILYKVLSVELNNTKFYIPYLGKQISVYYKKDKDDNLFCYSRILSMEFQHKISSRDIVRIADSIESELITKIESKDSKESQGSTKSILHTSSCEGKMKRVDSIGRAVSFKTPIAVEIIQPEINYKEVIKTQPNKKAIDKKPSLLMQIMTCFTV